MVGVLVVLLGSGAQQSCSPLRNPRHLSSATSPSAARDFLEILRQLSPGFPRALEGYD